MIKYIIASLVLCIAGCCTPGDFNETKEQATNTNRPIRVFIVAGQSNAVGYNNIKEYQKGREEFPKELLHQPRILFWQATTSSWGTLRVTDSGSFGPEIAFSYDLAVAMPDEQIAIIKYAVGGTGIARSTDYTDYIPKLKNFVDRGKNWHPPLGDREAGGLYQRLIENVRNAISTLDDEHQQWEFAGCLWMQGEHEAGISQKMAQDYEGLLTDFIRSVRADLKVPYLPFAIGEVNSHTWRFGDIVRDAQVSVCQEDRNLALVRTTDLPREGSGGLSHFDADGMIQLGSRFASAMIPLLNIK